MTAPQNFPFGAPPVYTDLNFPKTLRDRTVAQLKRINTLAGIYVDSSRAIPVAIEDAPRLMVYCKTRQYTWKGDNAPQFDALGRLTVIGYVTGASQEDVETQAELLGQQIMSLVSYAPFVAPPVERIASIDMDFDVKGTADRFEGEVIVEFGVKWTEIFEPVLAPLPNGYGAVGTEIDLTVQTATGEVLTGATISLATS